MEKFTYVGGIICRDGSSEIGIQKRLGLASGVMQSLKKIWSSKDISAPAKMKAY